MEQKKLPFLPPRKELETKAILKKAAAAHRHLAELKGISKTIPNETILLNTLILQEAKDSSAVENIITTHDELFRADLFSEAIGLAQKEVQNYRHALKMGFDLVRKDHLLTNNIILQIQKRLETNDAGFRKVPGTALKNDRTGEVVYMPPQHPDDIESLMFNLERIINDHDFWPVDPLIKMAAVHVQFESIHPFYDGNGRTGRIINILFLVVHGLLDLPILYLSRFIIQNKADYYRLLQKVRDDDDWESWMLFMLDGIIETSIKAIELIGQIKILMADYKKRIRTEFPKMYSQDLLNNLFRHPYTRIPFLENELNVNRSTASRYLDRLVNSGYLERYNIGVNSYFINRPLFKLFAS